MDRVDLGNDQWFELFDPDRIPRSRARAYRSGFYRTMATAVGGADLSTSAEEMTEAITGEDDKLIGIMESQDDSAEMLVTTCVSAWSFGEVDSAAFDLMSEGEFQAVHTACVDGGHEKFLMPDFGTDPDPDSPTLPS